MLKNLIILLLCATTALATYALLAGRSQCRKMDLVFEEAFKHLEHEKTELTKEIVTEFKEKYAGDTERRYPYYRKAMMVTAISESLRAEVQEATDIGYLSRRIPMQVTAMIALSTTADTAAMRIRLQEAGYGRYLAGKAGLADSVLGGACKQAGKAILKADIAAIAHAVIGKIYAEGSSGCTLRFDNHFAMAIVKTPVVYAGDRVEGALLMAQTIDGNNERVTAMTVNGKPLTAVNSVGSFGWTAGAPGTKPVSAKVELINSAGSKTLYTSVATYRIERPGVLLSIDNNRTVYVAEPNPISVMTPVAPTEDLRLRTNNGTLTGGNGKYLLTPEHTGNVKITVAARIPGNGNRDIDSFVCTAIAR